VQEKSLPGPDDADDHVKTLIHDLRVHQIELELQNEELRETQKHLELARDSYARLFHQAPVGYLIVDHSGVIVQVNATFLNMMQRDGKEIVGKPLSEFIVEQDQGVYMGRFKAFFKNPTGKSMDLSFQGASGSFPVRMWGRMEEKIHAVHHGKSLDRGLLLMLSDISEQKKAEAALVTAKEAAEASARAKSDFLVNMSHELRTPLNGLLGMLQLLEDAQDQEERSNILQIAKGSANRLTGVLGDILDLSKMEAGGFSLNAAAFMRDHLVQSVRDLFMPVALEKGVRLDISVDSALPEHMVGDEPRIRQILFHLVGNALKFTSNGHVHLSLEYSAQTAVGDFGLDIVVTDTGIGMTEEQLGHALDSFYQVDSSLTKAFQGVGLGLTIVHRLAELMRGTLKLQSNAGHGTTVRCEIPMHHLPQSGE